MRYDRDKGSHLLPVSHKRHARLIRHLVGPGEIRHPHLLAILIFSPSSSSGLRLFPHSSNLEDLVCLQQLPVTSSRTSSEREPLISDSFSIGESLWKTSSS